MVLESPLQIKSTQQQSLENHISLKQCSTIRRLFGQEPCFIIESMDRKIVLLPKKLFTLGQVRCGQCWATRITKVLRHFRFCYLHTLPTNTQLKFNKHKTFIWRSGLHDDKQNYWIKTSMRWYDVKKIITLLHGTINWCRSKI